MKRTPKKRMDYTDWSEEDHIEHLRTHKPYQDFFANFKSESIEAFITKYGHEKYDMFQKREQYRENYEEYETQFLTGAEMYIDMILQKKLLNLQCQWRADLLELPLVDICQDFQHWERHIRACPFIPPVTADELELCIRFLKEEYDFTTENYIQDNDCQDYIAFKNQIVREEFEDSNEAGETAVQLPREERCYPL